MTVRERVLSWVFPTGSAVLGLFVGILLFGRGIGTAEATLVADIRAAKEAAAAAAKNVEHIEAARQVDHDMIVEIRTNVQALKKAADKIDALAETVAALRAYLEKHK